MQQHRAGEEGLAIPQRSERFYKVEDDWYFLVRGGARFGPYPCREEADRAVHQLFHPAAKQVRKRGAVVHPIGSQRAKLWRNRYRH